MSKGSFVVSGLIFSVLCIGCGGVAWWLVNTRKTETPKSTPLPATVSLKEDQINLLHLVKLEAEALKRLDLRTGVVEAKAIRPTRTYGGEVTIPVGQAIQVAAPLGGTIKAPVSGLPRPGQTVRRGQPIYQLWPLLSPESRVTLTATRIEAEGQVKSTQTQVDAAQIALDRAKRLFQGDAGSKRGVDEAQAQVELAKKALEAATARRDLLQKMSGELDQGMAAPLLLEAPEDGLLRTLAVQPGQTVPSGAPLFEVIDLERVWVRVPVYVGDLRELDERAPGTVNDLTAPAGTEGRTASSAAAPPSANAVTGTVDRFFDLDNRRFVDLYRWEPKYAPGERVGVSLPLKHAPLSLTVPWSAVIHDIHGGTWVYEETGERTYMRRRVIVRFVTGSTAVLAADPKPFKPVVSAGAAELFGTETGFSK